MSLPWPLAKPIFVLGSGSITPAPTSDKVEFGQVSDTKTAGSSGGASVAGAWTTRVIQTLDATPSGGWLSLPGSNQFTIDGIGSPGKYVFEWQSTFYKVERVQTRLFNVTGATAIKNSILNAPRAIGNDGITNVGSAALDITASTSFRLEYLFQTADALGLGPSATAAPLNAELPIFSIVKIWKIESL